MPINWPYDDDDATNPPKNPNVLPKFPTIEGYQRSKVDTRLISEPDAGPNKIRNRFTAAPIPCSERYILKKGNLETLEQFYKDLGNGAERFVKPDPLTRQNVEYRFVEPFSINILGGVFFEVVLSLEIMPS